VDALEILLIEGTALKIALGELQTLEGYVIQVAGEGDVPSIVELGGTSVAG
jgi:hypothetical protein